MGSIHKHMIYNHESQPLSPPIKNHQTSTSPTSDTSFPILPIAVIMATAILLITYYILLNRCCLINWQHLDPLRRFSLSRPPQTTDDHPFSAYSPSSFLSHGLDELLIREIPTFQFQHKGGEEGEEFTMYKCVVCLNDFQEKDMLRKLPKCGHGFHLDCIDVWLQSNANCPLCRSSISGETRCPVDRIVAPTSSPQDPRPNTRLGGDEDFVVIELSGADHRTETLPNERLRERNDSRVLLRKVKQRKFVSIMGDECIEMSREKDDQFSVQPIRRSFSMDSAADPHVYLAVQEIMRQSGNIGEGRSNREESSSRMRRSFFPFGHGRGSSRSAVLPLEF